MQLKMICQNILRVLLILSYLKWCHSGLIFLGLLITLSDLIYLVVSFLYGRYFSLSFQLLLITCNILLLILLIMQSVNVAYGYKTIFIYTAITSGEVLTFCGGALAFVGTFFLGIITLYQNKELVYLNKEAIKPQKAIYKPIVALRFFNDISRENLELPKQYSQFSLENSKVVSLMTFDIREPAQYGFRFENKGENIVRKLKLVSVSLKVEKEIVIEGSYVMDMEYKKIIDNQYTELVSLLPKQFGVNQVDVRLKLPIYPSDFEDIASIQIELSALSWDDTVYTVLYDIPWWGEDEVYPLVYEKNGEL